MNRAITALFWVLVAALAVGLIRRGRRWAAGRSAPLDPLDLFKIPKRYFVDLHHVVAREPYIARTHVAVAGGAVLAILVIGVNYGLALYSPVLDRVLLAASCLMLAGAALVA